MANGSVFNPRLQSQGATSGTSGTRASAARRKRSQLQTDALILEGGAKVLSAGIQLGSKIFDEIKAGNEQEAIDALLGEFSTETAAASDFALGQLAEGPQPDVPTQIKGEIDTLSELRIARDQGAISTSEANIRANVLLTEAKKANPRATRQLDRAFAAFFGGESGVQLTAQEARENAIQSAVLEGQLKLQQDAAAIGMDPRQLAALGRKEKLTASQKSALDLKVKTGAASSSDVTSSMAIQYDDILATFTSEVLVKANKGELNTDEIRRMGNAYIAAVAQADRDFLTIKNNYASKSIPLDSSVNDEVAKVKKRNQESLEKLLTDNSYRKAIQANTDIMGSQIKAYVMENAPQMLVLQETFGAEGMRTVLQAVQADAEGNSPLLIALQKNPVTGKIVRDFLTGENNVILPDKVVETHMRGTGYISGTIPTPVNMDSRDALGVTMKGSTRAGMNEVVELSKRDLDTAKNTLRKAYQTIPEGLSAFKQNHWQGKVAADPKSSIPIIESGIDGVLRRVKAQLFLDGDKITDISKAGFREVAALGPSARQAADIRGFDLIINGIPRGDQKSNWLLSTVEVAELYPALWKDEYDSAIDFIKDGLGLPIVKQGS